MLPRVYLCHCRFRNHDTVENYRVKITCPKETLTSSSGQEIENFSIVGRDKRWCTDYRGTPGSREIDAPYVSTPPRYLAKQCRFSRATESYYFRISKMHRLSKFWRTFLGYVQYPSVILSLFPRLAPRFNWIYYTDTRVALFKVNVVISCSSYLQTTRCTQYRAWWCYENWVTVELCWL